MKKTATLLTLALGLLLGTMVLSAQPVSAQTPMDNLLNDTAGQAGFDTAPEQGETGAARILGSLTRFFISMIGVIFLCYTVYGGFLWMTAAGNDDKVSKSKNIIRDGIIGILITLSAATIYILVYYAISPKT